MLRFMVCGDTNHGSSNAVVLWFVRTQTIAVVMQWFYGL